MDAAATFANPTDSKCPRSGNLERAFTLVELMVVILIISLMATLAITTLGPKIFKSKVAIARANMKDIEQAIEMFYADQGKLPDSLGDLTNRPGGAKEYPEEGYLRTLPKDPWKYDYHYMKPGANGRKYDLISYGADGSPGGEGDNRDVTLYDEGQP